MQGRTLIEKITEIQHTLMLLQRRRVETQRALDQVKDLLRKTEARRLREPQNQRKWNNVLDHLGYTLDEAKARHEAAENDLQRVAAFLRQLRAQHGEQLAAARAAGADEDLKVPEPAPNLAAASFQASERELLDAPLESLGQFSLEHISLVQSQLLELPEEANSEAAQLLGRLELANQVRDGTPVPVTPEEPQNLRRQLILRQAIEKIQSNRIDSMNAEETRLVISCYALLTRRINPTPKDERLIRIVGAAIKVVQRKNAEFKKAGTG